MASGSTFQPQLAGMIPHAVSSPGEVLFDGLTCQPVPGHRLLLKHVHLERDALDLAVADQARGGAIVEREVGQVHGLAPLQTLLQQAVLGLAGRLEEHLHHLQAQSGQL